MNLHGAKVLVTGGTSGIGLKTVEALIQKRARVIVVARDVARLERVKERYPLAGAYLCDLGDPVALVKLGEELLADHPDLQVLINNAGMQYNVRFDDEGCTADSIEYELRTNLLAPMLLIRALLPSLTKQSEAAILNVTTGLALVPKASSAVYCGSKGGLRIFTQALRNQLEGTDIRVIEVLPPIVDTPMTAGRGKSKLSPDTVAKHIVDALQSRKTEVYVAKTKLLYGLMRISPYLARRLMRKLG